MILAVVTFTVGLWMPTNLSGCYQDTLARLPEQQGLIAVVTGERLGKLPQVLTAVPVFPGQKAIVPVSYPEHGYLYRVTVVIVDNHGNPSCPSNTAFVFP